ncbi:MAG: peptidoglycan editing factor PgeF [Alphaproteobacteria bacterium]|nr:peptidoglycan editing factor PgeF [Alphaproteobacteria bacterium]
MTPVSSPFLSDIAGVAHGFFGRQGGVSEGIYASLNCGFGSNDDVERVTQNRRRVAERLGSREERLITVYQIHSADVVTVDAPWARGEAPKADAMVTNVKGIALGVLAADCTPVLFADATAGVIGSAHAGWKGAIGGVAQATVRAMEALGAERGRIRAAIGPCIGPASYEVGPEFFARFNDEANANRTFFRPSARESHFLFDLPGFVAARLAAFGVSAVDRLNLCTYEHAEHYFSYRRTTHRGESDYGRNISAIMLKS